MQLKQSRSTLILFGVIGTGILVLVISLMILQHLNTETQQVKNRVSSLLADYKTRELKLRHLRADEESLNVLDAHLAQLDKNLIAYQYVPTYLKQIQGTAVGTVNLIKSIQPGDRRPLDLSNSPFATAVKAEKNPAQGDTSGQSGSPSTQPASTPVNGTGDAGTDKANVPQYQVMNINLDVEGSYVSIVKLLNAFRLFPKMIYVKSIDLTPQRGNGKHSVSARIQTCAIITPDQYKTQQTQQNVMPGMQQGSPQNTLQANVTGGGKQ